MYKIKSMLRPAYNMFFGRKKSYYKQGSKSGDYKSNKTNNDSTPDFVCGPKHTNSWKPAGFPYAGWQDKAMSIGKQINKLFYDNRQYQNTINEILLELETVAARLGELEKKPKRGRPRKSTK